MREIVASDARTHEMEERQPRPGIYHRLPVRLALLEPAPTRTRPRRALQEQIRVPPELTTQVHARRERLDILDLRLADDVEHVARPLLDEGHEAAVAERAVGPAEGEVVGEGGHGDGEVGDDVARRPEVAEVDAGAVEEGEARDPGRVWINLARVDWWRWGCTHRTPSRR